jgi:hypothetical protein
MLRLAAGFARALALGAGLIVLAAPAAAHGQAALSLETGEWRANDGLRPGQYRWHPEAAAAAAGPVAIVVSLPLQRAWVFRAGALIGLATISSGQPGYDTPAGSFRILEKDADHRSNRYDDAPMPYMLRLTWDGVALHGGAIPGRPASHGCIRLPRGFARQLFAVAGLGARVVVSDEAPGSPEEALALAAPTAAPEQTAAAAD